MVQPIIQYRQEANRPPFRRHRPAVGKRRQKQPGRRRYFLLSGGFPTPRRRRLRLRRQKIFPPILLDRLQHCHDVLANPAARIKRRAIAGFRRQLASSVQADLHMVQVGAPHIRIKGPVAPMHDSLDPPRPEIFAAAAERRLAGPLADFLIGQHPFILSWHHG